MSETGELTSNELTVLESLQGSTDAVSQRELARRTGFSVGLVNAVLKKLIHTGYVKTSHLNRRSLEYLLTPQGFAQTALRSYRYIVSTMRGYREIQEKLVAILSQLKAEGYSEYYLHGEGELAELVVLFFEEAGFGQIRCGMPKKGEVEERTACILNTEPVPIRKNGWKAVDLISEFSACRPEYRGVKVATGADKRSGDNPVDALRSFYKGRDAEKRGL